MRYLVLLIGLALAGCASLSEGACRGGDWYGIGVKDGSNGRSTDFVNQHAKACADYGIAPKAAPWRAGRDAGLKRYCTPRNAYDIGARGQRLSPVCSGDTTALDRAHDRGRLWHQIGRDIRATQHQIDQINTQLATLAPGDPSRTALVSERSFLKLDLLSLRAERLRYRL